MKNRFNVCEEFYFSLLFHLFQRKMKEKSVEIFPPIVRRERRSKSVCFIRCRMWKGVWEGREFHRCLNSIAISLEKIQSKTSGTMVQETMFTSRWWRPDGSLWRNWRKEKKKKEMVQWDGGNSQINLVAFERCSYFFFFFFFRSLHSFLAGFAITLFKSSHYSRWE